MQICWESRGASTAAHSTPLVRLRGHDMLLRVCPCGFSVIGIQYRAEMLIENVQDTDEDFKNKSLDFFLKLKA